MRLIHFLENLMKTRLLSLSIALLLCSSTIGGSLPSGVDRKGIDESIRPQDNLFLYANGEWLKHTPIPEDRPTYGSFEILSEESEINIREIIKDAVKSDAPQGSLKQKVGDYFKSYMDEGAIETRGLEPLKAELTKVDEIKTKEDLMKHFGYVQSLGIETPIGLYVDQDDKNSEQYLTIITQSGTSLPDRDYYLKEDEKYQSGRAALKKYIVELFEYSELTDGKQASDAILTLEKQFAQAQWTRTELRDANKRYNKFNLEELAALTPTLAWNAFLSSASLSSVEELNVTTPSFFEALDRIVEETPLEVWKQYLKFQTINAFAEYLPQNYADAQFNFYRKELAGIPIQKPRWKRAVRSLAGGRGFGALGDAVGELYVQRHFPKKAEERMAELVDNLLKAYESSIHDLTWMTPTTKKKALEKLSKITTKIGYTKKWRDYSKLDIKSDDLIGNVMRSSYVEYRRMIDKLGRPIDRDEWHMTPQTVNAYYNPSMNEIVFPAAILQPPFFDVDADPAVNYGGIGSVIGHEISHAFDDQGSKYDGDGNLENWWTDEDRAAFSELTSQLVAQYEAYSPLEGKNVNGKLTLGENIADLSGMSISYKAYFLSLKGKETPVIDGWTGPQRFFMGWAQSWRRKYRDAEMVNRLLTDPHSPAEYRAYGPCANFDPFYEAFDLKTGDSLFRPTEERIRIW